MRLNNVGINNCKQHIKKAKLYLIKNITTSFMIEKFDKNVF